MPYEVELENGYIIEFDKEPTPDEIDEVIEKHGLGKEERQGLNTLSKRLLPTFISGAEPLPGERTLTGDVFERPGAFNRAAIRENKALALLGPLAGMAATGKAREAAVKGANFPENVETFHNQSLRTPVPALIQPTGNRVIDAFTAPARLGTHFGLGLLRDIGAVGADIATNPADVLGILAGKMPLGGGKTLGGQTGKALANTLGQSRIVKETGKFLNKPILEKKSVDVVIDKGIQKGIRPSVKPTTQMTNKYKDNARLAVKTIVENKDNLQFVDDMGTPIKKLPETLEEFGNAISQTKKFLYQQVDDALKEAGDQGIRVELNPIVKELDKVINNKSIGLKDPSIIKYAEELKARLLEAGSLSPGEADDYIRMLNKSLESFYKNPSYDVAMKASVDSNVAYKMRDILDDAVVKSTGKEFQILKTRYGALKSIERDVNRRAMVDARKNVKGLIDFADIFASGDIVKGIVTLNPGDFAKGVVQRGLIQYIKELNDPNRIIKGMFKNVDKMRVPASKAIIPEIVEDIPKGQLRLGYEGKKSLPFNTKMLPPSSTRGEGFIRSPFNPIPTPPFQQVISNKPQSFKQISFNPLLEKGAKRTGEGFVVEGGKQVKGQIGKKWAKILRSTPPEKAQETIMSMPEHLRVDAINFLRELWAVKY